MQVVALNTHAAALAQPLMARRPGVAPRHSAALSLVQQRSAAPAAQPAARRHAGARCQAAPVATVVAEPKFEPQVCVVLGTQWGDEGKGKLVDILAQEYEIVARAQVRRAGRQNACAHFACAHVWRSAEGNRNCIGRALHAAACSLAT